MMRVSNSRPFRAAAAAMVSLVIATLIAVPAAAANEIVNYENQYSYDAATDYAFFFRNAYKSTVKVAFFKDDDSGKCTSGVQYPSGAQSTKTAANYINVTPGQILPLIAVTDASCRSKASRWMVDVRGPGINPATSTWTATSDYLIGRFWFFGDGRISGNADLTSKFVAPWDQSSAQTRTFYVKASESTTSWKYALSLGTTGSLSANGSTMTLAGTYPSAAAEDGRFDGAAPWPSRDSSDANALTVTSYAANLDTRLLDDWCERAKYLASYLARLDSDVVLLQGMNMRSSSCTTDATAIVAGLWSSGRSISALGTYGSGSDGTGSSPNGSNPADRVYANSSFPYVSQFVGGAPVADQPASTGGAVILSKYPLTMLYNKTFTNQSVAGDKRGFVIASILKADKKYVLINAGMDPNNDDSRTDQLDQIGRAVADVVPDGSRLILGGNLGVTLGTAFNSNTSRYLKPTNYDPDQLGIYRGNATDSKTHLSAARSDSRFLYNLDSLTNFYNYAGGIEEVRNPAAPFGTEITWSGTTTTQTSYIAPVRTLPKTSVSPYSTADFDSARYEAPLTFQWWNHEAAHPSFKNWHLSNQYAVTSKLTFSTRSWTPSLTLEPTMNETLAQGSYTFKNVTSGCSTATKLFTTSTVRQWRFSASGSNAFQYVTSSLQVGSDGTSWSTVDSAFQSSTVFDSGSVGSDRAVTSTQAQYVRYCVSYPDGLLKKLNLSVDVTVSGTGITLRGYYTDYGVSSGQSSTSSYVEDPSSPAKITLNWSAQQNACLLFRKAENSAVIERTNLMLKSATQCGNYSNVYANLSYTDSLTKWYGISYSYMFCVLDASCSDWIRINDPHSPKIASSGYHTCMVGVSSASSGAACWGVDHDTGAATIPSSLSSIRAISAGVDQTCALASTGKATCWGDTSNGDISPGSSTLSAIAVGADFACGINVADNKTRCWGPASTAPPATLKSTIQLAVSDHVACAVDVSGSLRCWGDDSSTIVSGTPSGTFVAVAVSDSHACAVKKTDGNVTCWGKAISGNPQSVPSGLGVVASVTVGYYHSCARKFDNSVTCWGLSDLLKQPSGMGSVTEVSASAIHTCAVKANGLPTCWGLDVGQLTIPKSVSG
ncbi:hypothetical protein [Actinoplanes sp. NPDC051859]|uniref:hypothetical protein n=1 Tax=Actinoplanes sp. NPDC051859 TaxID=3363909 RepID=UPI0037B5EBA5